MKAELKAALELRGWDAIYEAFVPNLAPPNAKGERRSCSPFSDTVDHNPSFSINVQTGLWRCFKTDRGGDFVSFKAILMATEFDPQTGLAVSDYGAAERELLKELGVANAVDPKWVDECVEILQNDPGIMHHVTKLKPWNPGIMRQLKIGWSPEHGRIVIPIYDRNNKLVNCRMYRPGAIPKFVWRESNLGGNFLWPRVAWRESSVILVEGEPDALSLRSWGFPALSGTLGKGHPVPDGDWWFGKYVYVLMDADKAGAEATESAVKRLRDKAADVRVCTLPEWEGRPDKADISDYIIYLRDQGFELEQIQRCITEILSCATQVELPHHVLDQDATDLSFRDSLNAANLGKRVRFTARVTAKSTSKFVLPTVYDISCPAEGHSYCKRCPMYQVHGLNRFMHDPRQKTTLKLIQTSEEKQIETMKEVHGIAPQCPEPKSNTITAIDVEAVILNATPTSEMEMDQDTVERQRREAFVLVNSGGILEENRDYIFEGFMYAHPKTQQSVFLLDKFTPATSAYENFHQTSESMQQLRQYCVQPGQTVADKLIEVAHDLSISTTLIYGRPDLHLAYRTVFHSVLSFPFAGRRIQRGWLECLVLGDTRCGKSEAFRQMSSYYGLGLLIDCKMQSVPGILGTVVQASSGEYYVVAGLLPQQDGRVVCFDEFVVPKWAGQSIIEVLSSTRSEGIVRISKAAHAEFRARVRSIWLANPGGGKLISQSSDSGVELIKRVIGQPEDIARFDLALTVAQSDVPPYVINNITRPTIPVYGKDVARMLLSWTYSRKPEHVYFTPEAEEAVIALSLRMCAKYESTIPLVEVADQRIRVAKMAVSVAAQVFSTNETGEMIVVTPQHVDAVEFLYTVFYDKPVMGYDQLSTRNQDDNRLVDENQVLTIFDTTVAPNGRRFAEELLRLDQFSEKSFRTIVPMENIFGVTLIQMLYHNRAVHLVNRGKSEFYEKTPAFTEWLKRYVAR